MRINRGALQVLAIIVGSSIIGSNLGWQFGTSIGLIAWAVMPAE